MDKETIQRARQADLPEYLMSIGVQLTKSGNRYRHKEHDSLIFTGNSYFWNSKQDHGNAVDYLTKYMNMDFLSAVSALANTSPIADNLRKRTFEPDKDGFCLNQDKVKRYLNKARLINYGIINHFIERKILFQESGTDNAYFPMLDERGNCVGAELQGTKQKRFKGIKANSKYGYGFNIGFSANNTFDYALFFESAIDLMSFIDYEKNFKGKTLDNCLLVSMAGLKISTVKHTLKSFPGKPAPVLCVDNDEAGRNFLNALKAANINFIERLPEGSYKDWNEQLVAAAKKQTHFPPFQING
jgi:hypothetical protein